MGSVLVVVDPPGFEEDLGLEQGLEDLDVQELVAEPPVEGLDPGVLPRLTGQSGPRMVWGREGRIRSAPGAASEGSDLLFVPADLGGDGFETLAEMIDLDNQA